MQYRQLGDSGIEVSAICLGSWLTYGVGVDDSAGRACVDASLDAGINFIDTANIYGRGAAASFLRDALTGQPRAPHVLATKLFFPITHTANRPTERREANYCVRSSISRCSTSLSKKKNTYTHY